VPDWTEAVKEAHVDVAVAAFNIRLFERHGASEQLQGFAREQLSEALDRLEQEAPGLFVEYAANDATWIEELRRRGAIPEQDERED
jgi:hypothetical protein